MVPLSRKRSGIVLVFASTLILGYAGCDVANLFLGRLNIRNSTGEPITSVTVKYQAVGMLWKFDAPDLPHGVTCACDHLSAPPYVLDHLTVTWADGSGTAHSRDVPFRELVPDRCEDDFLIEIGPRGKVHASLEVTHTVSDYQGYLAMTFILGLFAGVFLMLFVDKFRSGRSCRMPIRVLDKNGMLEV